MRCCKRHHPMPSNVEIRAVITRCVDARQNCNTNRNIKKTLNRHSATNIQAFQGFDEDEPLIQSQVTKCVKKLILTIKMKNAGETNTQPQFIVIDHVYDPLSDKTVRLLNPYVIKMRQEQVSQAYGLRFVDYVNSQAKEQVYNKHDGNYTGCSTNCKRPTCGSITHHGNVIPYSTGFCCSCDAEKNAERQPPEDSNSVIGYSDPAYLYDAVQCPRTKITTQDRTLPKKNKTKQNNTDVKKQIQRGKKGTSKRNMDNLNVYYVDPRTQYLKRDGAKFKQKLVKDTRRTSEENNLSDEYKSNGTKNKYPTEESNYKIQTMNEDYEDQLVDRMANPNSWNLKSNPRSFRNDDKYGDKSQESRTTSRDKHKTKSDSKNSIGNHDFKDPSEIESNKMEGLLRESGPKPSMHKLLHRNAVYSLRNIYHHPNSKIRRKTADRIVNETIKTLARHSKRKFKNSSSDSMEFPDGVSLGKRQIQSSGVQRRGGQNCADRYTPPHVDPQGYHESTHCLRFSPVWYGVYKLDKPVVDQEAVFQIFEKYDTPTGSVKWKDMTRGRKVKLGTFNPYFRDEVPTISMTFTSVFDDEDFCLDWNKLRLLIPEGVDVLELPRYPEGRSGPPEYLLVPTEKIVLSGDKCNVAGVGFEAFYKQPNRCSMPRGSCLHHQPFHLWHYDKTLERSGKKGCFFLKHHGHLSKNPIKKNDTSHEKFLSLDYFGKYVSMVDMEINADFNAVLRPTSAAVITEVYIDSTCTTNTVIIIKVSNSGLLSSRFKVRICDCPLELKDKFNNMQSELVIIPPQQQHIFKLTFHASIDVDIFHCSVEALNADDELVALRRIKIQKFDRCICTWHCLCACIGSSTGLKCVPMKVDHYHAAGFKGGMPIVIYASHFGVDSDIYMLILFIILFIIFTFVILGLTKGLIGLCCLPVGMWGLNVLLDLPKPMNKYYERKLGGRYVIYDETGWPIHPDTKQRVRNIPVVAEFCTNILFFFSYPTVVFLLVLRRICCPFTSYEKPKEPPPFKEGSKEWIRANRCGILTCGRRNDEAQTDVTRATSTDDLNASTRKMRGRKGKCGRWGWLRKVCPARNRARSPRRKTAKSPRKKGKSKCSKSPTSKKSMSPQRENSEGDVDTIKNEVLTSPRSGRSIAGKGDEQEKPIIKVAIKERDKKKLCLPTSKKKRSVEVVDNPYYYSSTDDITSYSSYSRTTNRSPSRTSSA
ncbi:hypothetical protein Trydic_g18259 [Trypoxylus dichotomus]